MAFWDFVQAMDQSNNAGEGVDHTAQHPANGPFDFQAAFGPGFPFGGPRGGFWGHRGRGGPWARGGGHPGHHGRRGRHCGSDDSGEEGLPFRHRGRHCHHRGAHNPQQPENPPADGERGVNDPPTSVPENEKQGSPDTIEGEAGPSQARSGPPPPPYGAGPFGGAGAPPFDLRGLMGAFASHPFARQLREYLQNAGLNPNNRDADNNETDADVFVPPVDIFTADTHWTLHIALPGAKKEDLAVNWDAEKSQLAVTGVVYRPGDEEFLKGLTQGERKVGMFERKVRLPPQTQTEKESKDEVDAEGIKAKMEDGVLVVTVPKVEKDEWTEVRKVDIE
jgi:HSP20 family protein